MKYVNSELKIDDESKYGEVSVMGWVQDNDNEDENEGGKKKSESELGWNEKGNDDQ